jgi:hypothetical protein
MTIPVIVLPDAESKGKAKEIDATSSGWIADVDESGGFEDAVEEEEIENRGHGSDDSATMSKAVSALFMAPCPEHSEFEDPCPACRARTPSIDKVLSQELKVGTLIHDLYASEQTPGPSNRRPISPSTNSEEITDRITDSYFPNQWGTGVWDTTSWTAANPTPIRTPSANPISSSVHRKATKTLHPRLSDLTYLHHTKHFSVCSENRPVAKELLGEMEGGRFHLKVRIHGEEREYMVPFKIRVLTTGERPFVTVREPKRWWDWLGDRRARKDRRKLERKEDFYNLPD